MKLPTEKQKRARSRNYLIFMIRGMQANFDRWEYSQGKFANLSSKEESLLSDIRLTLPMLAIKLKQK